MKNLITSIIISYLLRRGIKKVDGTIVSLLAIEKQFISCGQCRRGISLSLYYNVRNIVICPYCNSTLDITKLNNLPIEGYKNG
jgi:hypothetical protein